MCIQEMGERKEKLGELCPNCGAPTTIKKTDTTFMVICPNCGILGSIGLPDEGIIINN